MAGALAAVDDARVEAQLRLPRPTIVITASVKLLTSALEESIGLAQTRKDLGRARFRACSSGAILQLPRVREQIVH